MLWNQFMIFSTLKSFQLYFGENTHYLNDIHMKLSLSKCFGPRSM